MSIRILPEEVAIKISAGEVVERPLSVVKELIENSIDAQATEIKIQIRKGGRELIEVVDDGVGIAEKDIRFAAHRHATSKIQNITDLEHITSLGFRGEALASIAAVSIFTIQSHAVDESSGNLMRMEGGKFIAKKTVGGPHGTLVRVENLFFNTPARFKFLKQELTEKRAIIGLIQKYALAYSSIQFQLVMDGKVVLQTSGKSDQRQVLPNIYSLEEAKQMLEVDFSDGYFQVNGFTSPIGLTRSNRKEIIFFVNGRLVFDSALTTALIQAYHTYLMVGRFPFAILLLKIPPEDVDVNVHPAKSEVRFKNPAFIFSLVQRAVRLAILRSSPPEMSLRAPGINPAPFHPTDLAWTFAKDMRNPDHPPSSLLPQEKDNGIIQSEEDVNHIPLLRLVGQIAATYLVAEGPDGLYLIDQHAAHERILFEKFNRFSKFERPKQQLLDPSLIHLNPADFLLLLPNLEILNRLGFEIDEFGSNTIRVKSVPSMFSHIDPMELIKSCIENLDENEIPLDTDVEQKIIARICKRSAVRGGQILSLQEQAQLIKDLEQCHSPRTCPHGRPTMIHLSVDLLERQFGRRGSR